MVEEVSLRRPHFGRYALVRLVGFATLSGLLAVLFIGLGHDDWFFVAVGIAFLLLTVLALVSVAGRRTAGSVTLSSTGVTVASPTFLRTDLHLLWSQIERITTTAIGDGAVLDVQVVQPTLVLVLKAGDRRIRGTRWRANALAMTLGSRSNADPWHPPTWAGRHEKIGLNLDCEPDAAEQIAQRWSNTTSSRRVPGPSREDTAVSEGPGATEPR